MCGEFSSLANAVGTLAIELVCHSKPSDRIPALIALSLFVSLSLLLAVFGPLSLSALAIVVAGNERFVLHALATERMMHPRWLHRSLAPIMSRPSGRGCHSAIVS